MSWLNLVAATVMVWVGGRAALPYMATLVALTGVVSWVSIGYAARLGVRADQPQRLKRGRLAPYLVLLAVVLLAGMLRETGRRRPRSSACWSVRAWWGWP